MMNYLIYGIYNFVFQIAAIGFLFYANTYLNELIIPNSLRWKNGRLREDLTALAFAQVIVLIVETLLLMLLFYFFNKWYLSSIANAPNSRKIAFLTAVVFSVITVALIIITTYLNFR
jgi:hypothetical protein